jgi:hypothetical protein
MPFLRGDPWKTGGYGTTVWHNPLDCGHVLSRKRRLPPGIEVDCPECDEDSETRAALEAMPDPSVTPVLAADNTAILPGYANPDVDPVSSALEWAAFSRAAIAHGLGLDPEQVDVVAGDAGIEGGIVVLGPSDVINLVDKLTRGRRQG